MKILKRIGIGIFSLIALILIIALFVKKEYAVERTIVVNKPKQEVFDYIKLLKNQDKFSFWATQDPAMKKEFFGTDGTVGFKSAWDSKKMGKGEQTIKAIKEGEQVDYALHFIKPFDGLANAYLATTSVSDSTTNVKWGFDSKMAYPMNFMLLFINMDKMMGEQLEVGLTNLKNNLETNKM